MAIAPLCFCAAVGEAALEALLEASDRGQGAYRDSHPWRVAQQLLEACQAPNNATEAQQVPILLAIQESQALSHYALIESIDVQELHRGSWESRVRFGPLQPVNPVWQTLDSLMLWPAAEQRQREALEGLRQHRTALTTTTLHPYAICETPAFIGQV